MAETYGLLEILRRARGWMPKLRTSGQRCVFGALIMFSDHRNGIFTPTYGQIADLTGYHESSVRRITKQIEAIGAIVRVGDRPVATAEGIARGGKVPLRSVPPAPPNARVDQTQRRNFDTPPAPRMSSTRSFGGTPLKVEELSESIFSSNSKLDPAECDHRPVDEDGYCTKCGSWVTI